MSHHNRKRAAGKAPAGRRPSVNGEARSARTRKNPDSVKVQRKPRKNAELLVEIPKPPTPVTAADMRDAGLLREAVDNPGSVEPPDDEIRERPDGGEEVVTEVPERTLDNEDPGTPLTVPPELMTVRLSKPTPHIFLQLYPDRVLKTALLAYHPTRDSSPEYYHVAEKLEGAVKRHMKNVLVLLVADMNASGEPFLWVVPRSDLSPYYNAISAVLARGDAALKDYVFRFDRPDLKGRAKTCPVHLRLRTEEDPKPILPSRRIGVLLFEALGSDRVIRTTDHPVYHSLTSGGTLA
jgi:hypothetical protein